MSAWTDDQLTRIGGADEVGIATARTDGSLRTSRVVWLVRVGDGLYLRSVNGRDAAWYRGTRTRMQGRLDAGGSGVDVTFVDAGHDLDDAIDDAYRRKYRYSPAAVGHITSARARDTTMALVPRPGD